MHECQSMFPLVALCVIECHLLLFLGMESEFYVEATHYEVENNLLSQFK